MWGIDDEVVQRIYKIQIQQAGSPQAVSGATHTHADGSIHNGPAHPEKVMPALKKQKMITNTPESEISQTNEPLKAKQKLSRNDPCPCGSGKKWKKCHYPEVV